MQATRTVDMPTPANIGEKQLCVLKRTAVSAPERLHPMAEQTGDAGFLRPAGVVSGNAGGGERCAGATAADCSTPAAPRSAEQRRRSLPNPFEARSGGKKQPHTLKWAVFEVLRDYPAGLGLAAIVRLVEERKLRSFAKTNPAGQALPKPLLRDAVSSRALPVLLLHTVSLAESS